jgi:hypothetical protein
MYDFRGTCGDIILCGNSFNGAVVSRIVEVSMERKLPIEEFKTTFVALILLAGFFCQANFCCATGSEQPRSEGQLEAVVIHVDEWAVYVPNLIFYFDTQMDKRKIETLKRVANQLRNKKALISYSATGDFSKDKHILLSNIVPAGEKPNLEEPVHEVVKPSGDVQGKVTQKLSEEKVPPAGILPTEPAQKQAALQEEKQSRKSVQSDPITKEEISAFVKRLLYLSGRKDLAAVAPFYADKVDYYDRGVISRDKVLQDLKYYFRNWAEIDTQLDGDVLMTGFEPEVRIVKFVSSFSVKNEKKSIAGKTENIWQIQRINGELKLIDIKQKILKREEPSGL